jgi:hypothetical protein
MAFLTGQVTVVISSKSVRYNLRTNITFTYQEAFNSDYHNYITVWSKSVVQSWTLSSLHTGKTLLFIHTGTSISIFCSICSVNEILQQYFSTLYFITYIKMSCKNHNIQSHTKITIYNVYNFLKKNKIVTLQKLSCQCRDLLGNACGLLKSKTERICAKAEASSNWNNSLLHIAILVSCRKSME